ncbi:XRE family transcriptional regulator [uncultured Halomonas sp.]|uniref:XRE family transcriptional regulator n=1 Tax=uncultured Halomonas sp. TaxID=173971 RepID=UPI002639B04E|nr:XRE family transcriptional regulator [uncultured Halomonas sp.]
MGQALINADMLSWARERAGLSIAMLAEKLQQPEDKVAAWEAGEARPTFRQAQQFAQHVHAPFGYLFLRQPPEDDLPIPDLRTVGDHAPRGISVDLKDVLRDVLRRQVWYRDYQIAMDESAVAVVGRAKGVMTAAPIVTDMREWLEVPPHPDRGNWEAYFRDLVQRIERLGILVMRSGIVGNNTRRVLSVEEFRGFAIADPIAPVIFINAADVPEARLFTLVHELAHIWLGESGISDGDPANRRGTEKLCNAVAAEFLVPEEEFLPLWLEVDDWKANLAPLAAHFHVSQWVIARRAQELGLISDHDYRRYVVNRLEAYRNREERGGASFDRVVPGRVSKRLAQAVASEALSGRLLLRDAYQLIGVRPHRLKTFARKELGL